jgi:hypothetical protein
MFKKMLALVVVALGMVAVATPPAEAGYYVRRVAPVRRAVLPPYPIARRAVVGPVVGPVVRPYVGPRYYGPVYPGPFYGPGVSVVVGF